MPRPTFPAATAKPGPALLPRPKDRREGRRYFRSRSRQPNGRTCLASDATGPPEPSRITPQTLTGNAPVNRAYPKAFPLRRKTLYEGVGVTFAPKRRDLE